MCWFRPAFAVALDCAATRAGDSAPGQTVRVSRIGSPSCLCNAARNAACTPFPELALVRAGRNLAQGRLDEAAAHLVVAKTHAEMAPPDRQRRLQMAIASLQLSLATRRGHLAGVAEQARFLASPVTGQSGEDIALGSDLRAVALMNLGIVEAWSLGLPDAERHLQEGAVLARRIGRPLP